MPCTNLLAAENPIFFLYQSVMLLYFAKALRFQCVFI